MPFIVAGPGIEAGSYCSTPVTGLDLLPTLAEVAGHGGDLPGAVDGGSLLGVLRGAGTVNRRRAFLVFHQAVGRRAQTAIRQGKWKLVKTWADDLIELFDLTADIGESRNLAGLHREQAQRMQRAMEAFLAEVRAETRRKED